MTLITTWLLHRIYIKVEVIYNYITQPRVNHATRWQWHSTELYL